MIISDVLRKTYGSSSYVVFFLIQNVRGAVWILDIVLVAHLLPSLPLHVRPNNF